MHYSFLKYKYWLLAAIICCVAGSVAAQQDDTSKDNATTLLNAFQKGTVHGRFRNYFMATINEGPIADYYANAMGGYIRYETKPFHGFRLVTGASFTFNVWSSDLTTPDAATGIVNRYEIGLFDITDPTNRLNIVRFDELHLKYGLNIGSITLGKQIMNTPFINQQDGRMRPTAVDAAWLQLKKGKLGFEGGWIYGISPRSTTKWYSVGRSVGLYPQGINPDGSKANYFKNLKTGGIALAGLSYAPIKSINLQLWEQYVENIFNTALVQVNYEPALKDSSKMVIAAQLVKQDAVNDGGNADQRKTYISRGSGLWVISARLGWQNSKWITSFNYTRITGGSRFLMPREWGRDPFFTFMPRERNEGNGDVNAFVLKAGREFWKKKCWIEVAAGYFQLPDVKNYALNKYGVPSYSQLNLNLRYTFDKALKGFDTELLYVYKKKEGDDYGNDRFVINKVNMSLINLVINYGF